MFSSTTRIKSYKRKEPGASFVHIIRTKRFEKTKNHYLRLRRSLSRSHPEVRWPTFRRIWLWTWGTAELRSGLWSLESILLCRSTGRATPRLVRVSFRSASDPRTCFHWYIQKKRDNYCRSFCSINQLLSEGWKPSGSVHDVTKINGYTICLSNKRALEQEKATQNPPTVKNKKI